MTVRIDVPTTIKRVTSADGTEIAYYVMGTGPRIWLMPPAMGAPLVSMKFLIERMASRYTIVSWDQRGFYRSRAPRDPDAMKVDDHLDDMEAVVAAEKLDSFVLGGWSMAVQVSLEYVHRHPEHVRALLLINGPYEKALSPFAPAEALALAALRAGSKAAFVLNPLSRKILGARRASAVLHRAGLVSANPKFFGEVLSEFAHVDWGRYFTMTRHLHHHSTAGYLDQIRVPTLVTTGTRDLLTPPRVAERLHAKIRGSELLTIEGASHYVVTEYPDELAAKIDEFLGRVDPA